MGLFTSILEVSIAMIPVILLLLLISPLLGKRYGAKLRCFMWLALCIRLLIPFNTTLVNVIPIQSLPVFGAEQAEHATIPEWEDTDFSQTAQESPDGTAAAGSAEVPATLHLTPNLILSASWGLGAGLFLLYHLLAYFCTYRKLWRWSTSVTDQHLLQRFARISNALAIKRPVQLRWSAKVAAPLLIGFLRPCIVLPYTPLDSVQLDFILTHELTHLKRGDAWFKLAALLANGVHWFNPIVWMISSKLSFDTELACDSDVLAGTEHDVRKAYGYTVLAFIEQGWCCKTPLTSRFLGGKKQMRHRFRNITDSSTKKRGFIALLAIVLIIALAGSTVYAAENAQKKTSYPVFKYTVTHMTKYTADLPDSDMLSMEQAAEAGAKYIYDLYGENGDGYAMWMSYMSSRNQWGGRVTKADTELAAGNIIFSFIIDAEYGKRIRMYDMRKSETELPEKSLTSEEFANFKNRKPDNLEKYEQLATEFARKHFSDDKVASVDFISMNPADTRGNGEGVWWYKGTHLNFVAADTTGRKSEITIVMETSKLLKISAYISDTEKGLRKTTARNTVAEEASAVSTVAEIANKITDLTLTAKNSNIILELSSDNQFHYSYDTKLFGLSVEDSGSSKIIQVSKIVKTGLTMDFVKIQIPNTAYNKINCNLDKVGLSLPALNSNIDIVGKSCAVGIHIPLNFNKTINYSNTDGSGAIELPSGLNNFKFTLDETDSAVSLPDEWSESVRGKTYTYQVGNANGIINANLKKCAFDVEYEAGNREYINIVASDN